MLQDGDTERAALRQHPHVPGRRRGGREGRVETDQGIRVQDAHAVRAHHAHPGTAHEVADPLLLRLALGPHLPEPGGDHHHAVRPGLGALANRLQNPRGGHRDDAEIDGLSNSGDARERGQALDLAARGVHGVDGAFEALAKVLEQRAADGEGLARRAEKGDGSRLEEGADALGGGFGGPRVDGQAGRFGQANGKPGADDARARLGGDVEAEMREEIHHGGRPGQHIGFEALDPKTGRSTRHLFEERGSDTFLSPGVGDGKRELRARHRIGGGLEPMKATEAHDLLAQGSLCRHQAEVAIEVVALEPGRKLPGQTLPVFGVDRANAQGFAVFEENVSGE